jgi:hypothetical protein
MALLIVGGILVLSAVVLVASETWDEFTPGLRLAIVALPMALCYAAALGLRARGLAAEWITSSLAFVGACIVPFAAWLAICLGPMGHDTTAGAMALAAAIGLVAQVATAILLRAPALTLPPSLTLVWLAGTLAEFLWASSGSGTRISASIACAGLVLTALGYRLGRTGLNGHAIGPNVIGALAALLGLTVLAAEHEGIWDVVSIGVPAMLIVAAPLRPFRPHLWAGALFLVVGIFRFGLSHFADSAGLPVTLLGCGLASLLIGYVVHRVRKEHVPQRAVLDA